ncbi:MAG: hypothetical protein KF889_01560 [Alphaproteobacteria bacterium]|nr:hypothetical protein [Alphaproteobacteria bacterium]MCW5741592.1 hypothetical protein [Alphaproteobacteria bacterium]
MATPLPNPFSIEGAKRISEVAGQKLATTPIDASTLTATPPIQTPAYTPPVFNPSTIVLPPIQNTPEQDALRAKQDDLITDIDSGTTKLGTKSARKLELETAQGIPQLNKDILELYDQANQIDAASVQMKATSEDRLAPTFAIVGEQASIDRQAAAKKAGIAAIATAKQGKLALAQDYVTQSLAAEFDPVEAEIAHKKFLLQINMDNFNVEEKRRAEARIEMLDQQRSALTEYRDQRAKTLDIMLAAAGAGADNATLAKIQAASSPEEATRLAGAVLGAKFQDAKQQQEFENSIRLAQLAIDQRNASGGGVTTDPLQALAYAQQYASTGTIPTGLPKGTFGVVAQLAKELPKPDGSIIDTNTGTKPAISDARIDGLAALYDISKKVADLKQLDTERSKGLILGGLGKVFGAADQQRYIDLRTEIVDLLSRARTGAALTASEEKFYADQLPGRVSNAFFLGVNTQDRIDNFASKINDTLDTKLRANQAAIVGYSKINIGGQDFTVGQIVTNADGVQGRVLADGSIAVIQQ